MRERLPQLVCVFAFERKWADVGAVTILGMTIYVWFFGLFVDGKLTTVDVGVCIEQTPERILFVTFVVSVTFWMFWLVEHSVDTVGASGLHEVIVRRVETNERMSNFWCDVPVFEHDDV